MKLSRVLTLGAISVAAVVSFASPAVGWCGTPQAEPTCPTTTVAPTTTTIPETTTTVAETTTTSTTVPETTTTVPVTEATTTTVQVVPGTTEAPPATVANAAAVTRRLPSTGNETGVLITAAIASLLAGAYLILRARRMAR